MRGNTKIKSYGERIMTKAKQIQKAHPSKPWRMCVKEASKQLFK